jgi:hypothetical protein
LRVGHADGHLDVNAGQAVLAGAGEWVRYTTPSGEGAEYIASTTGMPLQSGASCLLVALGFAGVRTGARSSRALTTIAVGTALSSRVRAAPRTDPSRRC